MINPTLNTNDALFVQHLDISFQVYGGTAHVLDDVTFVVRRGESVGLVGESGCGKTVAVKTVMGMIQRNSSALVSGRALLNGTDLFSLKREELLERIGQDIVMIPQDPMTSLNPVFTIGEQLQDVIRYTDNKRPGVHLHRRQVHEVASKALAEVRLPDPERLLHSYPLQLSGGMRQRVLIAMALVNRPQVLIADEPGTALDVTIQKQVLDLMRDLIRQHQVSVLMISHNLGVIREMTNRLYIMYAGQIAESAPSLDFFSSPKHPYSLGLHSSVPKITRGKITAGIPGTVPDYLDVPSGCRFHPRCSKHLPICSEQRPNEVLLRPDWYVRCHLYDPNRSITAEVQG